jgi:hypothetical protein
MKRYMQRADEILSDYDKIFAGKNIEMIVGYK